MTFRAGDRLGGLEILAPLKSGGMATLFLARRAGAAGFAKHVAVKVVHAHLASDPSFVSMFLEEARLSARIQHPKVVHVEELGEADGTYYLVMEYVHGTSLARLAGALAQRGERMPIEIAVAIALDIAEGLHAAHETCDEVGRPLGVVHRDVSPQNVLVAQRGFVKVIDFGIAKAEGRAATAGGLIKGKLSYMAPEQAYGRRLDRRVDVYALGVVLWELLAGRKLFDAESDLALIEAVRHPVVPDLRELRPAIDPALAAAVGALLAPDPDERPATAAAARALLAGACPGALHVGASHVAELVASLLSDELERERRSLPPSLSSAGASLDPSGAPTLILDDEPVATPTPPSAHTPLAEPVAPAPASARSAWMGLALAVLLGAGAGAWKLASSGGPPADLPPVPAAASVADAASAPAPSEPAVTVVDAGSIVVPEATVDPDAGARGRTSSPRRASERRRRDAGTAALRPSGPTILRELYP